MRPPGTAPGEAVRLLVVEEERIAADPGTVDAGEYASRIVYAAGLPLS